MYSSIKTAQTNYRNPDLKTVLVHTNRKIGERLYRAVFWVVINSRSWIDPKELSHP